MISLVSPVSVSTGEGSYIVDNLKGNEFVSVYL